MIEQIGSTTVILSGIKTLKDGSVELKFEANPSEQEVIHKLMSKFLLNEKVFEIGIISVKAPPPKELLDIDLD